MPEKPTNSDKKPLKFPAYDALVERCNGYLRERGLADATQAKQSEALGFKYQRDWGKLRQQLHAPGLDVVQTISEKTGIPTWLLVMPRETEASLRAVGVLNMDSHHTPSPDGQSMSPEADSGNDAGRRITPRQSAGGAMRT